MTGCLSRWNRNDVTAAVHSTGQVFKECVAFSIVPMIR